MNGLNENWNELVLIVSPANTLGEIEVNHILVDI